MNVHMRKLDDSVFVDVVYSSKNFLGLNIMSFPQTSFLLPRL